jgi:hypothetical protein
MDSPGADTLNFNCPACDTSLRVPLSLTGVKGPCPHCRVEITSPQPEAFQHEPEAVPAPAHTPLPVPQPSPRATQGESGPTSALQLQSQDAPPRFPQSQPAASIIRSPASRVTDQASASRTAVDSEPITNGVPLPARRDLPASRKTRDSLPGPSSTAPTKRRVILHPVSFVLVVLLSAGSGVVAMLLMNPLPAPLVPLPATLPLSVPAKPQNAGNVTSSGRPGSAQQKHTPPEQATPAPSPALTPAPPQATAPQPAAAVLTPQVLAPEPQATPPAMGVDAARDALDAFLSAASIDERIKHVQTPDFVAPKMELYYSKHPVKLNVTGIEYELSSPVPQSNRKFHIFQLTTAQHPAGFPVSVEETQHGCLVDWTSFIQFHDNLLGKFIRVYQPQPETFHAILERAHYFRSDVPQLGSKFCFRIKSPIPGYEGYAFINHGLPLADLAEQKFKWDHIYFPVVGLQWTRTPGGAQYIEITEIVQDNWRAIQ